MLENDASVKDMEAAALAYVAELAAVPFFAVKVPPLCAAQCLGVCMCV